MREILLTLHIGGGVLGILSGAAAMIFRKGWRWHVLTGQVFVGAMCTMAASGATLAVIKSQTSNILAGTLTLYLVATGWMAGRRTDGQKPGKFEWGALAFALVVGLSQLSLGIRVALHLTPKAAGVPLAIYFIFTAIVLLSAAGDIRMIAAGGVSGTKRLVRHLWRMTFSFFIASGSFFLGQQKVFPVEWRGAAIWWVLGLAPLVLLIGWLGRVWVIGWPRSARRTSKPTQKSVAVVTSLASR